MQIKKRINVVNTQQEVIESTRPDLDLQIHC